MTSTQVKPGQDVPLYGAGLLLVLSVCLGGGGSAHYMAEFIIEACALAILTCHLLCVRPAPAEGASTSLILLGIAAVLIAMQLLPLPAGVWHALPGRELAVAIAEQIGARAHPHALSLDPAATRRTLLSLLPAATMLSLVIHMDLRQRLWLASLAIGLALVSLILGLVQMLSAGGMGTLYPEGHVGFATGFFANRNHQATFLLIAIALTSAFGIRKARTAIFPIVIALSLAAGVIATRSRAGLLLLPVSLLPLFLLHVPLRRHVTVPAVLLVVIGSYVLAQHNNAVRLVTERIHHGNLGRLAFWQDSWTAIEQYWPVGAGFGTFQAVFRTVEPLDHIGVHYVNHAHNDLIELIVEGGLAPLLLLMAAFFWWAKRSIAIARLDVRARGLAPAGGTGLVLLLLHSLVDYPVRMLPISIMMAMLAGFLTRPATLAMPSSSRASFSPAAISQRRKTPRLTSRKAQIS